MATLLGTDHEAPRVLVLGSGTVGHPILHHLRRRGLAVRGHTAVPWTDDAGRREALADLVTRRAGDEHRGPLRVVWAAGSAGFSATADETAPEHAAFADVVDLTADLLATEPDRGHRLHVVSSAGGLFEGTTVRAPDAAPAPRRPYGELKLRQEELAAARLPADAVVVHRPSSIYGSSVGGRRPGLLGLLVERTLAQATTTIFGALTTLRDFVHADDVGRHIARAALAPGSPTGPELLVAGRPTSIHEAIRVVGSQLRRGVHLHFVESWNASDIVFTPSARAAGFRPAPVVVGIERVRAELLAHPHERG